MVFRFVAVAGWASWGVGVAAGIVLVNLGADVVVDFLNFLFDHQPSDGVIHFRTQQFLWDVRADRGQRLLL